LSEDSASPDVVLIAVETRQKCGSLMTDGKRKTRKEGIVEEKILSLTRDNGDAPWTCSYRMARHLLFLITGPILPLGSAIKDRKEMPPLFID
jgi:hypothetical protein